MFIKQRFFRIDPGAATSGKQTLGEYNEQDPNDDFKLRLVRVGSFGLPYDTHEHIEATIIVPGGCEIGPIDVPFRLNCELPCTIMWQSVAQSSSVTVQCTAADLPDPPNIWGATYFVKSTSIPPSLRPKRQLRPNVTLPQMQIPYWIVAVTVYSGDTGTWYDDTDTAIGIFTGPQPVPRPRAAVGLSVSNSGPVLFHY
jgi:hypothetical protein